MNLRTLPTKAIRLFVAAIPLWAFNQVASANTITMENYNGGTGQVVCTQSCAGFIGATVTETGNGNNTVLTVSGTTTLSYTLAEDYPKQGQPEDEKALLNLLLAAFAPPRAAVSFVNKVDGSGNSFTTSRQYFSIKQATEIFFFENLSGGSVNVALTSSTNNYSHYTEYGSIITGVPDVPLPAAAWLFGSALLGLVAVARRRAA